MNCSCIKTIEEKIVNDQPVRGQKVLKAKVPIVFAISTESGSLCSFSFTEIKLDLEGKKPQKIEVVHSYCPFCGTKTTREEAKDHSPEDEKAGKDGLPKYLNPPPPPPVRKYSEGGNIPKPKNFKKEDNL